MGGGPRWLSRLSILLLVSAKVVISGSWDPSLELGSTLSAESAWGPLPFVFPFLPLLARALSL